MSETRFSELLRIVEEAKPLGVRTLENGSLLVGHIPHVAPEGWLHHIFAPLNDSELHCLETQILRQPIPKVYRAFLLECCNGIKLFDLNLTLSGLRKNYMRTGDAVWQPFAIEAPNTFERPRDAAKEMFFFGSYKWDGSRLYLYQEKVFRCERESAQPLNEWPDFWTMLISEAARLSCLFDEEGREKNPDSQTTPNIDETRGDNPVSDLSSSTR